MSSSPPLLFLLPLLSFLLADPSPAQGGGGDEERAQDEGLLQTFQDPTQMPGYLGASRSGFLSRFDPAWNPAIGVAMDTVAEFSDSRFTPERWNRARVRSLELNLASRIDPLGWAYVTAAFADTGAGRTAEVEEAALWLDQSLPDTLSLRAGRFLADFGKWNPLHTHDKPVVNEDEVRREFFGGPLFLTGVELHHWFGIGDVPVRWSVGLGSEAEGDDHDPGAGRAGAEEAAGLVSGRRGIRNWTGTARFTAQFDVGTNGYFQPGISVLHSPARIETVADGGVDRRQDLLQTVVAADFTLRLVNAAERTGDTLSMELWHDRREIAALSGASPNGRHLGVWGLYEHAFSPWWAVGATASWVQHADDPGGSSFLSGGAAGAFRAGFVTWNLSEFNRLRLQVGHLNPGPGFDKAWTVALQWSILLGSHAHSIDW